MRDKGKDGLKIIGYLRVSNEKETLENQRFAIEQFAKEPVLFFWDQEVTERESYVSGAVSMRERQSWPEMIEYIDKYRPEKLYVFDTSRLGRDMVEMLSVMEELERKMQIVSVSPNEGFLGSVDPLTRKLMLAFLGWLNEKYRADLIVRTKTALAQRKHLIETDGGYVSRKSGKTVRRLGRIPWIYDRDPATGDLTINQERLAIAKRAIKMRYNGGSYDEIAKKLGISKDLARSLVKRKDFINKFP